MSDSCCGKPIDAQALQGEQRRVLRIVMAINIATFVLMIAAAMYSRSSALLSGALDNFGDALTYALSLAVVGASTLAKSKVAMFKAALILLAAIVVAAQIGYRLANPAVPLFEGIGLAATLNLAANVVCLRLLTPYRHGDVNLASAYECSRNDLYDGVAALAAAVGVWWFEAGWPDIVVAGALLILFLRSAWRVFREASRQMRQSG
jgi:Co/Zn/Cd efflux system component